MLDFIDEPLPQVKPSPDRMLAWMLRRGNRHWRLPRSLRISDMTVSGARDLQKIGANDRLVIVSNHPSHADAPILLEAMRRLHLRPRFLTAREVFLRGAAHRFVLKSLGAIPIDREAPSPDSLQWCAEAISGKEARPHWPLTVFAEGNVFLQQDEPAPFADGASLMALKACRTYKTGRVWIIPVAIRLNHHQPDRAADAHEARLRDIERVLGLPSPASSEPLADIAQRLLAAGASILDRQLTRRGFAVPDATLPSEAAGAAAGQVLENLIHKMGITPRGDWQAQWLACRNKIHTTLCDPDQFASHDVARLWADQAMLAWRLASYRPGYLFERLCLNRIAETVEKLHEDLTHKMPGPIADRTAHIRLSAPICVNSALDDGMKLREATQHLTSRAHSIVRGLIHQIRDETDAPDDRPVAEAPTVGPPLHPSS